MCKPSQNRITGSFRLEKTPKTMEWCLGISSPGFQHRALPWECVGWLPLCRINAAKSCVGPWHDRSGGFQFNLWLLLSLFLSLITARGLVNSFGSANHLFCNNILILHLISRWTSNWREKLEIFFIPNYSLFLLFGSCLRRKFIQMQVFTTVTFSLEHSQMT